MAISNEHVRPKFEEFEARLAKGLTHLKNEFSTVRAGRANPRILDKITVDYYGTPTPLQQMANVTVPEARMIVIAPYDISMVKDIVRTIAASDLGVSPADDGKIIRLAFPQLTEDRRKDLIKQVKKMAEDAKVALRNDRRDIVEVIRKFKKDNLVTEDEVSLYEKEVQKALDKAIESADKLCKDKEAEVLEI
ncbi:MAG: ribosome recycling factor [Firmicutes bacterium]|nr:ribosome recycling factor [Bacillota bacterium]